MAVVKCKCKYKFSVCTWWSFKLREQQELQEPKLPWQLEGMMGWLNWWVSTQVNLLKTSFLLLLEDQNDHDQPASQPTSQLVISNAFLETLVYPRRCVLVLVLVHVLAFCIDCLGGLLSLGKREKVRKSHGHGNNCKEWRVRSKLPRLSAKSYANIMFAFSTFIFNLPHFTFCFLPLRRCS